MTVQSGKFVSRYIEPREDGKKIDEEAIQPNGVDLSVHSIHRIDDTPRINNGDYYKGDRQQIQPEESKKGSRYFFLDQNETYIVVYAEKIKIPEDYIGLVLPRSRMMRCGLSVETAVWDSGYEGIGEGGLDAKTDAKLDVDTRIAQMVFFESESLENHYSGSHNRERI